jgi:hypothetical protein
VNGVLVVLVTALGLAVGQLDIARRSIQFDLRAIGESVYEARANRGQWPARIDDLDGTQYLRMPFRRAALQQGVFVVVWSEKLSDKPEENRQRVLAYDNRSVFSWFGRVWVCRGDLQIVCLDANQLQALLQSDMP